MPPNPVPSVPSNELHDRVRSVHVILAFLLGVFIALLSVKILQGRNARPLEVHSLAGYRLDLNTARPFELAQLPRVGRNTANLIVDARPFDSVDELRRVPGIGPATLEKVRPFVTVSDTTRYNKRAVTDPAIDPNIASLEELQTIPGIGPKMAQRIIDERAKQPFTSVDDMRRVYGIGVKTVEKLRGRVVIRSE
jgi:competence ComEA-like helix-hairpin-helix protein